MKDLLDDPPSQRPPDLMKQFDLRQAIWTLLHGWHVIALVCLLVVATTAYVIFAATPLRYAATATLRITAEQPLEAPFVFQTGGSGDLSFRRTEAAVIRSDNVLEQVAAQLDLVADPQFNRYLAQSSPWSFRHWRERFRQEILGIDHPMPDATGIQQKVIANLRSALVVEAPATSQLIVVTAHAGAEATAIELANTVVSAYTDFRIVLRRNALATAAADIDLQLSQIGTALDATAAKGLEAELRAQKLRLELSAQTTGSGVILVSPATIAQFAAMPRLPVMILSVIVGLLLGVTAVFMRDLIRGHVSNADELSSATGLRVLGVIARVRRLRPRRYLQHLVTTPDGKLGRDLRQLRTSLLLHDGGAKPPQLICVATSVAGEGASTVAIGLAQSLRATQSRVLLIDGDLQKPDLGQKLAINELAPADALTMPMMELNRHLHSHPMLGIDVLAVAPDAGAVASDIWSDPRSVDSLKSLKGLYDYVVIDAGAVLQGSAPRIISYLADMTIYVVGGGQTPISRIRAGVAQLTAQKDTVALVLNRAEPRPMMDHSLAHHLAFARQT